jgi:H/ACA ribonucleoprotein complex subunit 4
MDDNNKLPFEKIKRQIFIKTKEQTSPKFGCIPENRNIKDYIEYGIVNIDKPSGPTSHQISAYTKKILHLNKSGHSGTLDPKVTGVLPIALAKATRVVEMLLNAGKEYVAIMHIHKEIDKEKIIEVCNSFIGKIKQLPPIKSNVKRQERFRKIYYLNIIEIDGQEVLFKVGTQAGTYIRKLIHDIGVKLGCGAHMAELRRTKAGPFNESTLTTLQDLTDAYYYLEHENNEEYIRKIVMPMEKAVEHLPKIWVADTAIDSICHGASLKIPGVCKVESDIQIGENIAMMTLKNELIGIGTVNMISKDIIKNNRGIAVKSGKVFMPISTYPRIEK